MTMRFYDEDLSSYVEVPNFQFGDAREWIRGQGGNETVDGRWSSYDRGYKNQVISGVITGLTMAQRNALLDFIVDTLQFGMSPFYIRLDNNRRTSSWNPFAYTIKCGTDVGGATIQCGPYLCGERIASDYEYLGPLRIRKNTIKAVEKAGEYGGVFEVAIAATWEHVE